MDEAFKALKERFGDAIGDPVVDAPDKPAIAQYVFIEAGAVVEALRFLRDDPRFRFEHLSAVSGTDMQDAGEIHVAYILHSYLLKAGVIVKVKVPRAAPVVPSVERVFKAAQWHEREAYDLLGVTFDGNSDLRRILLPEDWKGHPLLKDYREEAEYHGMQTTRTNPLGKY